MRLATKSAVKLPLKNSTIAFISILLISAKVFAVATITSVTGVSNFIVAGTNSTAGIFGGMAGTCASPTTTSTCNTCTDTTTPIKACNPKSVNPSLVITVGFTSAAAISNRIVQLQTAAGSTVTALGPATRMTIAAGGSGSLTTTWGAICALDVAMGTNSSCAGGTHFDSGRTLGVGIDDSGNDAIEAGEITSVPISFQYINAAATPAQTFYSTNCTADAAARGACGFTLTAGDSKLYIHSFFKSGAEGSPPVSDSGDPDWLGVAFFVAPVASAANVTNSSSDPVVKQYDTSFGFDDSKLDGLTNYTKYCVMMGNINKAYNITQFTSTSVNDTVMCSTPSEVVGVLDDKHCFISTAAFGSDMAPEVETFRQFRNHFLLTNSLGKQFVKMYYKYSPPIADVISKNEILKSLSRGVLYPFLGFSYIALNYGILAAILTFLVLLILLKAVMKTMFRQKNILVALLLLVSFNLKAQEDSSPRLIQHPGAAEGLIKIQKDGSYLYNVKKDLKKESSHIYFGQANNPDVSIDIDAVDASGNPTGAVTRYNFDDFYAGASKIIIGYTYEWYPWAEKTMLGLQGDVGFMYADGHGRLVAGATNQLSQEKYSFLTLPLSLGAVYRFQYKDTQLFVPYVAGGGTYVVLAEKREDKSSPNFTGGFGFYGAGGLLINLTKFDNETAFELNSEYGIGNLWLSLEFKATEVEAESFKFSTQYVNAGFAFDF